MLKKIKISLVILIFVIFLINISYFPCFLDFDNNNKNTDTNQLNNSASLDGVENILITNLFRNVTLSGYGFSTFEDSISITNFNNNPINSIFIGIPLNNSKNLVFFKSTGDKGNTLHTERPFLIVKDYEMFEIYFDSPLLPQQTKSIKFFHQYKDLITFYVIDSSNFHYYTGLVYPILPYRVEGEIKAYYYLPEGSADIEGGWGFEHEEPEYFIRYELVFIEDQIGDLILTPYMENLGELKEISIIYSHDSLSKMEIGKINREISISPWGIMKIKDAITIENVGTGNYYSLSLYVPLQAKEITVSDDLGGLYFTVDSSAEMKLVFIQLTINRIIILPNTTYSFTIEYYLPFEDYSSINWFQNSIQLDILATKFAYLGKHQTIKIIIDGCENIDFITAPPESIKESHGTMIITYESDYVTPFESNIIQFTFTIDLFNLLLRPIAIMLLISFLAIIFVLFIKLRKEGSKTDLLKKEFIPVNEIREFCSLYEEKNALFLEISQADEDQRRKKISKNNYKKILDKNTSKIDEIQKEIIPFKKTLSEINITFENVINKLDVLEAERISVKDSLNLLESRYKRGRLPSRAAFLKLSDDFKKRSKRIERNIDKLIQQLRSYLL
ncbi:MAG: hypothetical protein ACFFCE_00680 [Promethearchaeota archaeon]